MSLDLVPASPAIPRESSGPGADWQLLNDFQRDFPLTVRPFRRIAQVLGRDERSVLERLERLRVAGVVSRVGPVFSPRRIGASTLAAMRVPVDRLDETAAVVSAFAGVNHNYAREHDWNLWFVVTAPDPVALGRTLRDMGRVTRCPPMALPLETEFHIDLGFDLADGTRRAASGMRPVPPFRPRAADELALMAAIQHGLPLCPRPFEPVARRAGVREAHVLAQLRRWLADGTLKRFGIVVRHHELGWRANAMCVWDVPDDRVDTYGATLAGCDGVTLCYRRRRVAGRWPYNLYGMIHGRDRDQVRRRLAAIADECGLAAFRAEVLFSTRRFKQCGADYTAVSHV